MYIGVSCPEGATINKFEVVRGRLFPMHSPQMPVMVARTIQPKGSSKEEMTLDTSQQKRVQSRTP